MTTPPKDWVLRNDDRASPSVLTQPFPKPSRLSRGKECAMTQQLRILFAAILAALLFFPFTACGDSPGQTDALNDIYTATDSLKGDSPYATDTTSIPKATDTKTPKACVTQGEMNVLLAYAWYCPGSFPGVHTFTVDEDCRLECETFAYLNYTIYLDPPEITLHSQLGELPCYPTD